MFHCSFFTPNEPVEKPLPKPYPVRPRPTSDRGLGSFYIKGGLYS